MATRNRNSTEDPSPDHPETVKIPLEIERLEELSNILLHLEGLGTTIRSFSLEVRAVIHNGPGIPEGVAWDQVFDSLGLRVESVSQECIRIMNRLQISTEYLDYLRREADEGNLPNVFGHESPPLSTMVQKEIARNIQGEAA